MSNSVGIPRDPTADLRTRRALQTLTLLSELWLQGTFQLSAAGRARLNLTDADIPSTITRDTELAAAIAALKFTTPLFDHFADASTSHTDGTEDDLYSDTLVASQLGANGAKLDTTYAGSWVGHATATRRVRVYFGGTAVIDTGNILVSVDAAWQVRVEVIRVSSSVVRTSAVLVSEASPIQTYTTVSEITGLTLSNTQVVKITGVATGVGAAAADIKAWLGRVLYTPAA